MVGMGRPGRRPGRRPGWTRSLLCLLLGAAARSSEAMTWGRSGPGAGTRRRFTWGPPEIRTAWSRDSGFAADSSLEEDGFEPSVPLWPCSARGGPTILLLPLQTSSGQPRSLADYTEASAWNSSALKARGLWARSSGRNERGTHRFSAWAWSCSQWLPLFWLLTISGGGPKGSTSGATRTPVVNLKG